MKTKMENGTANPIGSDENSQSRENYSNVRHIEGTAFTTVETEKGWILTIGGQMASKRVFETAEKATETIMAIDWELLGGYIYATVKGIMYIEKQEQN
jgi:hypothetical protein